MFKKRFLASLMIMSIAPALYAMDSVKENPFFKDSKIELHTRNHFKYLKEDEELNSEKRVHSAWGQSLAVNYRSGFFADIIGFDASYYGAIKLGASKYFATRNLLGNSKEIKGNDKRNATGYSKLGQRYVKLKFGDNQQRVFINHGWQVLPRFGALTRSYTLSPNAYLGTTIDARYHDLRIRAGYITSTMSRTSYKKENIIQHDGKKINAIVTGDIHYKNQYINGTYFYGLAEKYVERHGLELTYTMNPQWKASTKIYGTQAKSHWKEMSDRNKAFDNSAWHYVVDANWQMNKNWKATFASAYTKADKTDGLGYYPRHFAGKIRGNFNAATSAGSEYLRNKEKALFSSIEYKIHQDINIGLALNYGQFKYHNESIKTGEVNLYASWQPKDESLKGWSAFTRIGPGWSYKQQRNKTPVFVNSHVPRAHTWGMELIIDYKFNLL